MIVVPVFYLELMTCEVIVALAAVWSTILVSSVQTALCECSEDIRHRKRRL